MARRPRLQVAGGIYHVMARGVRRSSIYFDDADRREWLATLGEVVSVFEWHCHAYCLMTNHFHMVIDTPKPNLSAGMHRLNSLHAQWINWRYGLVGHVFDRRFHSVLVESEPHFTELARYVVLNPERAKLCERAIDWPWSSLRATLAIDSRPPFLTTEKILAQFADDSENARELYRRFIGLRMIPP